MQVFSKKISQKLPKTTTKCRNIAKNYNNVCTYAQKVVSLRKISNINAESNEKRTVTKT